MEAYIFILLRIVFIFFLSSSTALCGDMISPGILNIQKNLSDQVNYLKTPEMTQFGVQSISDGQFVSSSKDVGFDPLTIIRRYAILDHPDLITMDILRKTGVDFLYENNIKKYQILISKQPLIYSIHFLQSIIHHANSINIIQTTAENHGKIEPSGIIEVDLNTPYIQFTFFPENGYDVDDIIVDGVSKGPSSVFTLWQISNFHTIKAKFKEIEYFSITSQSSIGGSITPCCEIFVPEGRDKSFLIQANSGYELTQLNIDNKAVQLTQAYTFQDINASHDIQAFFSPVLPPEPDFTAYPFTGNNPLDVAFSNKTQNKSNEWLWDFGDGFQSRLKNPHHTYVEPGEYTVCLLATGPGGAKSIKKKNFVEVKEVETYFTASPSSGDAPLSVSFFIDNPENNNTLWIFGDGYTSTTTQPIHTYSNAGMYTVILVISNDDLSISIEKKELIHVNGRSIQGRVTASDTNTALNDYFVEIWNDGRLIQQTTTDIEGYYIHKNLPLSDSFILAVFPPLNSKDYYPQYYQGKEHPEESDLLSTIDNDLTDIDIVLEKHSDLGIYGCIFSDLMIIDGVQVNAYSQQIKFGMHAFSDSNGCYTLSGLKEADDYRVYILDQKTGREFYHVKSENQMDIPEYSTSDWNEASKVSPTFPFLSNINILANNDKGYIAGQVHINNHPAKDVWVYAHSSALNIGNGTLTDDSGHYTITSLAQVSETDPYSMGYIVSIYSGQTIINNQTIVYSDIVYDSGTLVKCNEIDVNFQLLTNASISGTVKNKYNHPIPFVNIVVTSLSTPVQATGTTDINGSYTIQTLEPLNDYIVGAIPILHPIQYYYQESDIKNAQTIDLSKGDVSGIDFILDEGSVIQGCVYIEDIDHPATQGIWVNIWSNSTQTGGDVITDSKGRYQITGLLAEAGDYIISIRDPNYVPAYYQNNHDDNLFNDTVYSYSLSKGVAPTAIHESLDRNLILTVGHTIYGKILYNALPLSGVRVEAWSESTGGFGSDVSSELLDGKNYIISGLPPALYEVQIYPENFAEQSYEVLIDEFKTNELHFIINHLENYLTGKIYGLEKEKQIHLSAFAQSINFYKAIQLIGNGEPLQYTISDLKPANDYVVELYSSEYSYQAYDHQTDKLQADRIILEDHVDGIDFTLQSYTSTISGNITFPDNTSEGDVVWIDAFSQSTTSGNGVQVIYINEQTVPYIIKNLTKANDYILNAWSTNYKEQYFDNQFNRKDATFIDTSDDLPDISVNFTLQFGASISGIIYCNNQPAPGIQVQSTSYGTNSWGAATSKENGSYIIKGLKLANDFIVDARKYGFAPFYYHKTQTTRSLNQSTFVSTITNINTTGIDIYLSDYDTMRGTIHSSDGKAIPNIWVNAWSEQHKTGFGAYSSEDGTFELVNLPRALDYKVSAVPHNLLPFISQEKNNISSNSQNVHFILESGFSIFGTVKNIDGQVIHNVDIELHSQSNNYYATIKTDKQGVFQISGLLEGDDYNLSAIPPEIALCIPFSEAGIVIGKDIEKNIVLKKGIGKISGYIYRNNGTTPLADILISLYSQKTNFSAVTYSKDNGFYEFVNIPTSTDYKIEASSLLYVDEVKINQLSDSTIVFNLSTGMPISGYVRDETGVPLSNVRVEVSSASTQSLEIGSTDNNGNYIINGLAIYNQHSYLVSDYIVKIYPNEFPVQLKAQRRAGDTVNFICSHKSYNELSGTVTDNSGQPYTADHTIIVKIFNAVNGIFIVKVATNELGEFQFKGLNPDDQYLIKFNILKNGLIEKSQWCGESEVGVDNKELAKIYQTGVIINFIFKN